MKRILPFLILLSVLPRVAHATSYGSLHEVGAVRCSATVNEAAHALGFEPAGITRLVTGRLTAEGLVVNRTADHRLVLLVDGLTLDAAHDPGRPPDTHFVIVRMFVVRDRAEGALVLWEDMAYGGWANRGRDPVRADVERWLGEMSRDFVLDHYRDAARARFTPTP